MRKKHFDLRIPTLIDTLINMIYKCFDFVSERFKVICVCKFADSRGSEKSANFILYTSMTITVYKPWYIDLLFGSWMTTNFKQYLLNKIYHTNSLFLLRIAFRHTKNQKSNPMWSCHLYICKKPIFECIFWFLYKEMLECKKKNVDGNALWWGVS